MYPPGCESPLSPTQCEIVMSGYTGVSILILLMVLIPSYTTVYISIVLVLL